MGGHPFGPKEVGYMYAYVGVLGVILQGGLIGRLSQAFGDWKLVRSGLLLSVDRLYGPGMDVRDQAVADRNRIDCLRNGVVRPALTSLITQLTPTGGSREVCSD